MFVMFNACDLGTGAESASACNNWRVQEGLDVKAMTLSLRKKAYGAVGPHKGSFFHFSARNSGPESCESGGLSVHVTGHKDDDQSSAGVFS